MGAGGQFPSSSLPTDSDEKLISTTTPENVSLVSILLLYFVILY